MLRFLTAGESHGPMLSLIIEGLPSNLAIDIDMVNQELAARQKGYGRGGRMLIEKDRAEVISGVRFGKTIGSPLSIIIKNRDWENWLDDMAVFGEKNVSRDLKKPRPGHADLTGLWKYDLDEARNILERASARETTTRVAVGAIAGCLLKAVGINAGNHVRCIGNSALPDDMDVSVADMMRMASQSDVSCVDDATAEKMRKEIDAAKAAGDTLGGIVEVGVENIMPGLGSHVHWDRRLDGRLAQAVMSIPAFKGVEIGQGRFAASHPGSMVHDQIEPLEKGFVHRLSNNAGGLEGGMTNGEPLLIKGYMKPIPTLMKPLSSVDLETGEKAVAAAERSDTTAVPAAGVVAEAMVKWVIAEAVLDKFSSDNMSDLEASVNQYKKRLIKGGFAPCMWSK